MTDLKSDAKTNQHSELRLRILSALILVPIALVVVWLGGWFFDLFLALVVLCAAWEYGKMVDGAAFQVNFWFPSIVAICVITSLSFARPQVALMILGVAMAIVAILAIAQSRKAGVAVFGVAYIGVPAMALALLRHGEAFGLIAILLIFLVVWATDIGGYIAGRSIGGPKLAPSISPGKTWSGAVGSLIGAAIAGSALAYFDGRTSMLMLAIVAIGLSCAAQIGDLVESSLKRRAGIKDSSRLIPGHGGVLDRIDGLMFAASAALVLGVMRAGWDAPAKGLFLW